MLDKAVGRITFIGGGNMGRSLIGGLINNGYPVNKIAVVEPDQENLRQIASHYNVDVFKQIEVAALETDVIVLAVKPQNMAEVCADISRLSNKPCLYLSIAAGVRLQELGSYLGNSNGIIRVMPNTPALVQQGISALYANDNCDTAQKNIAEQIMDAAGKTLWLDKESDLDIVTAISGSGPAYFFLMIEIMQNVAKKLGLNTEQAKLLVSQTALGAAKMTVPEEVDVNLLRQQVTSPGGTTEQALNVLLEGGIETLFSDAIKAAYKRSEQLSQVT